MKYMNQMIIGLLFVVLGACAMHKTQLVNIPLVWKPTSVVDLPTGTLSEFSGTKIQFEAFKDMRKRPEFIAENREDAMPKPVTTKDDVGVFVSAHVREAFGKAGLTTVDSGGDLTVSGEVRQFFVEETNTYKGTLLMHLSLRNRAGNTLWKGDVAGDSKRFGRSYSAENYYETFSDCIVNSVSTLLKDQDFQKALRR